MCIPSWSYPYLIPEFYRLRVSVRNTFLPTGYCNRLILGDPQEPIQHLRLLSTVSLSLLRDKIKPNRLLLP